MNVKYDIGSVIAALYNKGDPVATLWSQQLASANALGVSNVYLSLEEFNYVFEEEIK